MNCFCLILNFLDLLVKLARIAAIAAFFAMDSISEPLKPSDIFASSERFTSGAIGLFFV